MRGLLLILLLVLLAITWWALRPVEQEAASPEQTADEDPVDYWVIGLDALTFDAKGEPRRRLQARRLTHHRNSDRTDLDHPRLITYEGGTWRWDLRAGSGQLEGGRDRLWLEEGVTALQAAWKGRLPVRLETPDLMVEPDEKYAETASPVEITREDGWIRAIGMQAWLNEPGRIRFLADTRAHYVVQ